jgi:Zn-dependent protease/CBS domain-containing protein
MRWSWKIGKLAGIEVYVHATFLLLILFIFFINLREGKSLVAAGEGILFVLAIFACIVLHELGHALAARHYGIPTRDITLLPIGGVARLERMPDVPIQELWVALAGPAVNAVIAGALFGIGLLAGMRPGLAAFRWVGGNFLTNLIVVNFCLLAFNLIPAFPMDGGRVLRALLATRMKYARATLTAARVGQAIALLFGFIGLFTDPFLVFIALFVWVGAEQESMVVQIHHSLGGLFVEQAMLTNFRTLQPDDPLSTALEPLPSDGQHDFPVVFGDHVLGMLTRENLARALAKNGTDSRIRDAMIRDFPTADSHEMLEHAVAALRAARSRSMPVIHDGALVGLLTLDHIGEMLMLRSAQQPEQRDNGNAPLK